MIIRSPLTEDEFIDYYLLRWLILRAPWKQIKGSEKDELECDAIHRLALVNKKIVAVGRLHFINEESAQIRYMAVSEKHRHAGLGKAMLLSLEQAAKESNVFNIILDARYTAVNFYLKHGYEITKESHVLYGKIKHLRMIKKI
jgi:predicted GNAT family N-acyltransferase